MKIPPAPQFHHNRTHQFSTPMLIATAIAATIAVAVVATLAVVLYRRFSRGSAAATVPSDLGPTTSGLSRFSFSQLRRATSSFSPSHKLGQGGFGPVYRGALLSGQHVAVKLMDSEFLQGEREFQNELALASKILTMGSSPDRGWVVVPFGFCNYEEGLGWWRRRRKKADLEAAGECAGGGGAGSSPSRRLLLVYELMHNGSLQNALLDRRCPELLDWRRRFSIVVDIAHGLHFLHVVCEPPVIHGDIKPSNILLDSRLSAKIADFGLARLKSSPPLNGDQNLEEAEAHGDEIEYLSSPKISPFLQSEIGKKNNSGGGDDDASAMGETAECSTITCFEERCHDEADTLTARVSDAAELIASPAEPLTALHAASASEAAGFDRESLDSVVIDTVASASRSGRRKISTASGVGGGAKDWWWRQDAGSGGRNVESGSNVKDYVMEWIRSEIKKERPKSEWITPSTCAVSAEDCLPRVIGKTVKKKQQRKLEWWVSLDEERRKKRSRPAREWWREEFCEELTNKSKQKTTLKSKSNAEEVELHWWQKDRDHPSPLERSNRLKQRSWSRNSHTSNDPWLDGLSCESKINGKRRSREGRGSDIPKSFTVSSTPSMRGTICYVAPEYGGGGGPLSEKCDIYSFGVLLLVIVSGRRPLQVTASPMSEFERANLVSWARQLAHVGKLLDLVDPSLTAVDREQALLCITVGLLCIQRSPSRRPSIKEIVDFLTGQSEPPLLPLEFSPSPPGGFSFKSKNKAPQ
ncbi:Receptor-like serine/threonine-protein kinase [Platanthera guangdongensis]|uniref:Receptor-like serine/threonine-protein kinase n=1 Tax=Platanthera guangdongensis TaxID=2320717 RepID=A0ABR2LPA2_9ASPA